MKTIDMVSSEKLRGGFYTPEPLVKLCLDRISQLNGAATNLSVLEPSVGDGAFLRCLKYHNLLNQVDSFTGLEIIEEEAQKSRSLAQHIPINSSIYTTSALERLVNVEQSFDVVVGNPPFVRYQFISNDDAQNLDWLSMLLGVTLRGVSNLWIAVVLAALYRLKPGGVMAFVVPAEIFTGLSAGTVRYWLLANFKELQIDLFEAGSFPDVLQEVVIISGRKTPTETESKSTHCNLTFVDHSKTTGKKVWIHELTVSSENWTRYLLTPKQLTALQQVQQLSGVYQFGKIAKLEVSIVTGANEYFSVNQEDLIKYNLETWAEPLLPRIRHATGLIYTREDHKNTIAEGNKAWLLNFSENRPDPRASQKSSAYLELGEKQNLHTRYKTSIRSPWYRVPSVWPGKLLLSKRCHWFPRLVYNEAEVVTTDTIYRGQVLPAYKGRELDLVACFHNSLTVLTAELEGRSFGGGVLELVPSEIARLAVPFPDNIGDMFTKTNQIAKECALQNNNPLKLIEETDRLLIQKVAGLDTELMEQLQEARHFLLQRRLSRN